MSHLLNWVWHSVTRCPESDLEHTMYGTSHCRGCGRVIFVSDVLPKMSHRVATKHLTKRNRYL